MNLILYTTAALCVVAVAMLFWLCLNLLRQNGRLLLRLEAIEAQMGGEERQSAAQPAVPVGLDLGSDAPEFELSDLTGQRRKLSEWRGKRVLLIFFNPGCGYCVKLAPRLAALPVTGDGDRPVPILITTSDVDSNRKVFDEHG